MRAGAPQVHQPRLRRENGLLDERAHGEVNEYVLAGEPDRAAFVATTEIYQLLNRGA